MEETLTITRENAEKAWQAGNMHIRSTLERLFPCVEFGKEPEQQPYVSVGNKTVHITLSKQDAAKLADLMGANVIIPEAVSRGCPSLRQPVYALMGRILSAFIKTKITRDQAKWTPKGERLW